MSRGPHDETEPISVDPDLEASAVIDEADRVALGDAQALQEPEAGAAIEAQADIDAETDETPGTKAESDAGLVRASSSMAVGTVASRITGTVRDIAIVAAIGFGVFADTFSVANTVPNIIYILLAGGALNAIFIPQLMRHASSDADGGNDYAQRLLTLVAVLLVAVTLVAVLAAPLIIGLYGPSTWSTNDVDSAVLFARFCLPQILFYGLFTMFSQVLNSRGHFAAPMFAPIANNVVVIATALFFITVVSSTDPTTSTVTGRQIALLGIGTTLGIAVQAFILIPMMRRAGFVWRPRFGFRGVGLGKVRYLAGWTFLFVLTNQVTYVVITRLAAAANVLAENDPGAVSAGYTSYSKAFLLFMLPHSIITVSIVTFLLPRMSRSAALGRRDLVADDIGTGSSMAIAVIAPAAIALFLLGPRIAFVLFGFGAAGPDEARFVGTILQAFVIGLVPFTIFYVLLRGFYAFEDTRTPALINIGMNLVNVGAAVGLYVLVDERWKVPALALGYALSYLVTVPVTWLILRRRTGALPTYTVVRTLVRVSIASLLAGVVIFAALVGLTALFGTGRGAALVVVIAAGALGAVAYLWLASRLRVAEVREVLGMVRGRFARA